MKFDSLIHADYGDMVEIETGKKSSNVADVCFGNEEML